MAVRQETRPSASEKLARWLVEMDDPDPQSAGCIRRRTITLTHIIDRAREAISHDGN